MARLDAKFVAEESPKLEFWKEGGASSAPVSAIMESGQQTAASAKSGVRAVTTALIMLAQFVRPSQYDDNSRSAFCLRRKATLPLSFAASVP
jgi:hypothetical protein